MLTQLHGALSQTVWLFFLFLGLWGLLRALRGRGVDGSYLGALVIGELLFVAQAVMGTILWLGSNRPGRAEIHLLYGIFAVVFLPFLFGVLRGDDSNRGQWVFALANLFMFGVALRMIETGG
jgi:hypothetical protein